tara:strand:- start:178 stop:336 length:159 start_codon:yes stop_codon:yes gene_type:complete
VLLIAAEEPWPTAVFGLQGQQRQVGTAALFGHLHHHLHIPNSSIMNSSSISF